MRTAKISYNNGEEEVNKIIDIPDYVIDNDDMIFKYLIDYYENEVGYGTQFTLHEIIRW